MWPGPPISSLPIDAGRSGKLVSNLPFPLHAGDWELALTFRDGTPEDIRGLAVEIVAPGNNLVHRLDAAAAELQNGRIVWRFNQQHLIFALTVRIVGDEVMRPVSLEMPMHLASRGAPTG